MIITHTIADITDWFLETLATLRQSKEMLIVGLAGGTSYDLWYGDLLAADRDKLTNLQYVRWIMTDERVNCDVTDRNDAHIWEVFLGPLCEMGLSKEEYFIRPAIDDDGKKYSNMVDNIDIAFFGIGPDGHTASIFPHAPEIDAKELGFIKVTNAPKPPPNRITLSPLSIQSIRHVCLFAVGTNKIEAFACFLDPHVTLEECPAKLLRPEIVFDGTNTN